MEYCVREWHSAHLPVARTKLPSDCSVSALGRARLIRKAASTRANAMTTAMNTGRNDILILRSNPVDRPRKPMELWGGNKCNAIWMSTPRNMECCFVPRFEVGQSGEETEDRD